jgi:small GTP-binding protein
MAERRQPYGYRPIGHAPRVLNDSLPERERERALNHRQHQKSMKSYKVLLIGESGVGKSTLVGRLCEDRFMPEHRQYTLGFDMFEKEMEIDNERIKVYLWDTVGTETFDSITTSYYRGGAGIIVVYDISMLQSFNQLIKWINYVQIHGTADVCLMLLGSKSDLDSRREVTTEEGRKVCQNGQLETVCTNYICFV